MAAYVVVNVTVEDPVQYEEYRRLATPTVTAFGGRYLVRGGAVEVLEGDWRPNRYVVLEFPDEAAAKAWWSSGVYAEARAIRRACARTEMILVSGAATPTG